MHEEDIVTEPEANETEGNEAELEVEATSLARLTEKISELTKQIEKLEKMNENLMRTQHVDDVDDSKLFSIFNRYNKNH